MAFKFIIQIFTLKKHPSTVAKQPLFIERSVEEKADAKPAIQ